MNRDLPPAVRGVAPLPVAWYFDEAIFAREQAAIFTHAPHYVGHERAVPNAGDYLTLAAFDHGKMLVRSEDGVRLLGNVCRHRQARMLAPGRGNVGRNIVCPVHRWTYDLEGHLCGAPEFDVRPDAPLPNTALRSWNGLLFAGEGDAAADLADFPLRGDYDFSGYVLDRVRADECPYNWKTFLELYLELYHVEPFHPGLRRFVDAGRYEWGFGERWSYQILGINDGFRRQDSPHYARYRDAYLAWSGGALPKYGTVWSILYPNLMLEWYPGSLVVSAIVPRSPGRSLNVVEFWYPEEVTLFERDLVEAHQAAYSESAAEDMQACVLLHEGRATLWVEGEEDVGPYHSPHEDGMAHFHDYVRRALGEAKRSSRAAR